MIYVKGGTFTMGNDNNASESPAHSVTLTDFYMAETEVTQELWQAVMGSTPSKFKGDKRPVDGVCYDDCLKFIEKLNSMTGLNFRLPTESEWEFAAKGGNKGAGTTYSGSDNMDDVAWQRKNSRSTTHDVKTKLPNELGIYDMTGNVWEWCMDWYGEYNDKTISDPKGLSTGSNHLMRGGCWKSEENHCSTTFRNHDKTIQNTSELIGLRLVLPLSDDDYLQYTDPKEENNVSSDNQSIEDEDVDVDGDEVDNEEPATTTKSSNNWDQVLNDYESYVDSYIKLLKKAKDGDMAAMAEYANMLEKAQSFSQKLEKAGDDLTAAQMARYTKITAKMTKAAAEM